MLSPLPSLIPGTIHKKDLHLFCRFTKKLIDYLYCKRTVTLISEENINIRTAKTINCIDACEGT